MIKADREQATGGMTLVGLQKIGKVGIFGNCMTLLVGSEYVPVLNIVDDERVPKEAYRTRGCFCRGGDETWERFEESRHGA